MNEEGDAQAQTKNTTDILKKLREEDPNRFRDVMEVLEL